MMESHDIDPPVKVVSTEDVITNVKRQLKLVEKRLNAENEKESKKALREHQDLERQLKLEEKRLNAENEKESKEKALKEHKDLERQLKLEEKRLKAENKKESKKALREHQDLERQVKLEEKRLDAEIKKESKEKALKELKDVQQQRKLEETRLKAENEKESKEKALKGMKYLLGVSQKYSHFFKQKTANVEYNIKGKYLKENNNLQDSTVRNNGSALKGKDESASISKGISQTSKYFVGGTLHPYQIEGVAWMSVLYENGLNGILADEMGLGKTIQIIALVCHLYEKNVPGPYLIVVPLSTLPNWRAEFERFASKIPVVVFHGRADQRKQQKEQIMYKYLLDKKRIAPVVLTSYQVPLTESKFLNTIVWEYLIVDEGHRLKNHESKLSKELKTLHSKNRLLLTGTPLQNDITELWALLHFLLPHIFNNIDTFASLSLLEDMKNDSDLVKREETTNVISTIHQVLAPFILRRLKSDVLIDMVPKKQVLVYCPISSLQKDLYNNVLERNLGALQKFQEEDIDVVENISQDRKRRKCVRTEPYRDFYYEFEKNEEEHESIVEEHESIVGEHEATVVDDEISMKTGKLHGEYVVRLTMGNPLMMYRKIVNHPYLIYFPLNPNSEAKELLVDENLVTTSGKMMVLDALLPKLRKDGHKVLLFCTLVIMLDLVEEYLMLRGVNYERLDGAHSLESREKRIESFNNNPDVFIFLISTRAGGLGLNLIAADTVIFYDRDWNPQADIQAQDRCHRLGQVRPVVVYTLVTKNTIDDEVINRGTIKRRLEKIVIRDGKFKTIKQDDKQTVESDLLKLRELLNADDASLKIHSNGLVYTDEELNKILDRTDLHQQMKVKQGYKENEEGKNSL